MPNLKQIESGLIPVYESEKGSRLVNVRELHAFLEVGRDFTTWIKDRIEKYGFIENQDYILTLTKTGERQNVIQHDYIFKLEPAKEIAMVENNEKGKQIRKYFIAIENKYHLNMIVEHYNLPKNYPEALRALAVSAEENAKLLPKAESFDTFMNSTGNLTIEETAKSINLKGIGRNKLFNILVFEKILFRKGHDYEAYQNYINSGYFIHKQNPIKKGTVIEQRTQVFVTPKGLDWLLKELKKRNYAA